MPQSLKRLWYRPRALNLGFEMSMNPSFALEGPQSGSESLTGHVLNGGVRPTESCLSCRFASLKLHYTSHNSSYTDTAAPYRLLYD